VAAVEMAVAVAAIVTKSATGLSEQSGWAESRVLDSARFHFEPWSGLLAPGLPVNALPMELRMF
jgi:hypothetical protein